MRATDREHVPSWLRWMTRGSLALGIAGLVATVAIVGIATIADHLRAIGVWFLVLIAIEAIATCCDAGAVYLMTRGAEAPSWRNVAVAQFAGRAVNSVTPAANLGEALKVSLLARHCSTQRAVAAILFVAITAIVVSLLAIASGTALTAVLFHVPMAGRFALVACAVVVAGAALAIVTLVRRGMLASLSGVAARLHLLSRPRRARWRDRLDELDARLRCADHRRAAAGLVLASQLIQKTLTWVTIVATGYQLSAGQLVVLLSAGVVLGWLTTLVPMGLGVAEGGNAALFALIGAPVALGVALALARRVNQIVFALLGFGVLAIDRLHDHLGDHLAPAPVAQHP